MSSVLKRGKLALELEHRLELEPEHKLGLELEHKLEQGRGIHPYGV